MLHVFYHNLNVIKKANSPKPVLGFLILQPHLEPPSPLPQAYPPWLPPPCLTVSSGRWRSPMTQPLKPRGNASRGGYLCGHCVFFMLYFEARWVPGSRLIPGLGLGLRPGTLTLGPEREVGAVTPPPPLAGHQGLRSSPPNHRGPMLHPWNPKSESAHLSCGLELPHTGLHGEGSGEPPAGLEVLHARQPPSLQDLSGHVPPPPVPPLPVLHPPPTPPRAS